MSYEIVRVGGKPYLKHRLVWELENGPIPLGYVVHHKDGNKKNNSLDNLELLTRGEHTAQHRIGLPAARPMTAFKCAECGVDAMSRGNSQGVRRFCSNACKDTFHNALKKAANGRI